MGAYRLFEVFGIEIEWMIVDRISGQVWPVADRILRDSAGAPVNERSFGPLVCSNELAAHVLEGKTPQPVADWAAMEELFQGGLGVAAEALAQATDGRAALFPGAMHPLMDPVREGILWPHGQQEIYALYNRVFDCRTHGWMNLQSVHLNLPFADEEEFARLHSALILALPLVPALAAASPFCEGRVTGWQSTRLQVYAGNQKRFASITGSLIPEACFSAAEYAERIYAPMMKEVAPINGEGILEAEWLNSRAAIARFDRMAIEVRVIDAQECVRADLAVAAQLVEVVRYLCGARGPELREAVLQWPAALLREQFMQAAQAGRGAPVVLPEWGAFWDLARPPATLGDVWRGLREEKGLRPPLPSFDQLIADRLERGLLAERMRQDRARLSWSDLLEKGRECLRTNTPWRV